MSIQIGITADFTDMDRVMGRLMAAMDEGRINRTAAKVARLQIKERYTEKFKEFVSEGDEWQKFKRAMRGIPHTGIGMFTGATFESITAEYDKHMGRVFLAQGMWPQGSGRGQDTQSEDADGNRYGRFIEWGSFGIRMKRYRHRPRITEYPAENLATKTYGNWRQKKGPINWLFLDNVDIEVISDILSMSLDAAVTGGQGLAKKLIPVTEAEKDIGAKFSVKKGSIKEDIGGGLNTLKREEPAYSPLNPVDEFLGEGFLVSGGKAKQATTAANPVAKLTEDAIRAYERELLLRDAEKRVSRLANIEVDDVKFAEKAISFSEEEAYSPGEEAVEDATELWLKQHGGKRKK